MKKCRLEAALSWAPVLVWAAIIFWWSSQTKSGLPENSDESFDFVIKKTAHLMEYGIFAVLLWHAFSRTLSRPNPSVVGGSARAVVASRWWHPWAIVGVVALYAASDEFHQRFSAGRTASVRDIFIDIAGGVLALLVVSLVRRRRHPLWFGRVPWLGSFLDGLLPLWPGQEHNPAE